MFFKLPGDKNDSTNMLPSPNQRGSPSRAPIFWGGHAEHVSYHLNVSDSNNCSEDEEDKFEKYRGPGLKNQLQKKGGTEVNTKSGQEDHGGFLSTNDNDKGDLDIDVLAKKLAGRPSPMGSWALPYASLLLVVKSGLSFGGLSALPYVVDLVNCERVVIPFGHHILMVYLLLQIVDTYRNAVQKDDWPNYVHHVLSFLFGLMCYVFGSNRMIAFGVLNQLNELPGPAYQVCAALMHMKMGTTEVNWYALKTAYWMNLLVRVPAALFVIGLSFLDIYRYYTNQNGLHAFDEIQPWCACMHIFGLTVMLGLDSIWTPKLNRYAEGVARVLAAKEDSKKHDDTMEKSCNSDTNTLAKKFGGKHSALGRCAVPYAVLY